jgi:hypothetical protein
MGKYISFLCVAVLLCISVPTVYGQGGTLEVGTWWITESRVAINMAELDSGSRRDKDLVYKHKWVVEKSEQHKGEDVLVVAVYAHEVPAEIQNDHKGEYLFRLWLAKSDLALRRFDSNFRSGKYLVTGTLQSKRTLVYEKRQPVILSWLPDVCPLDIPIRHSDWDSSKSPVKEGKRVVRAEKSGRKIEQTESSDGDALVIQMTAEGGSTREQKWVHGCPWWREWKVKPKKGKQGGFRSAKTIDWKGKETNGPDGR